MAPPPIRSPAPTRTLSRFRSPVPSQPPSPVRSPAHSRSLSPVQSPAPSQPPSPVRSPPHSRPPSPIPAERPAELFMPEHATGGGEIGLEPTLAFAPYCTRSPTPAPNSNSPTEAPSPVPSPLTQMSTSTLSVGSSSERTDLSDEHSTRRKLGAPNSELEVSQHAREKRSLNSSTDVEEPVDSQQAKRRRTSKATASATVPPTTPVAEPDWFKNALSMLTSSDLGPEWRELVRKWADFEAQEKYQQGAKLGTLHRPISIRDWIQRGRSASWRPVIVKPTNYGKDHMRWWASLQPPWRLSGRGTIIFNATDGDWEALKRPGVNGLLSVVGSLFHWGIAVQKDGKVVKNPQWIAAVRDCSLVYDHLLQN